MYGRVGNVPTVSGFGPIGVHVPHSLCSVLHRLLEWIKIQERSLHFPNRLAHAIRLGEAFLLLAHQSMEVLQCADASILHKVLQGQGSLFCVRISGGFCILCVYLLRAFSKRNIMMRIQKGESL